MKRRMTIPEVLMWLALCDSKKGRYAGSGDGGMDELGAYIVGNQPRLLFFTQTPYIVLNT